jgi:hypothetical protein
MKQFFPIFIIFILSCNTNKKNFVEKKQEKLSEATFKVPINDTIEKVKNIIDIAKRVTNFDSLPENYTIFPKKYFDSIPANFLVNNLKNPIPICKIFNSSENYTSSVLKGTHLLKIQPKGNFEIAGFYSPYENEDLEKHQIDSIDKLPTHNNLLVSGKIIIFTNYPLICNENLFIGVETESPSTVILQDIKVGDKFNTVFKKLGYSYLKSKNILFYHDWNNTVAKFIIKDNTISKISVVRYDINLSDTLPNFILNSRFIPESRER